MPKVKSKKSLKSNRNNPIGCPMAAGVTNHAQAHQARNKQSNKNDTKFGFKQNPDGSWDRKGRSGWTSEALKVPAGSVKNPVTGEDIKRDRRHMISSNLLTDSLAGYLNHEQPATYTAAIDQFIMSPNHEKKLKRLQGKTLNDKLNGIGKYIHSNPKNLFPGRGDWNQAIGRLAEQVKGLVDRADKSLKEKLRQTENDFDKLFKNREDIEAKLKTKDTEIESATDNADKTKLEKEKSDLEAELKKVDQEITDKTKALEKEAVSYVRDKLEKLDSSAQGKEILETATKYIDEQGTSFARVRNFLEDSLIPSLDFDFFTSEYDDQIAVDDNAMDTSDEESTSSIQKKITEKPLTSEAKKWVANIQKKSLGLYVNLTQFRADGVTKQAEMLAM
ncbi:hypothetical protein BJP34_28805 [Moorena producens PAL-8-15-08-1]|uniref:Uncharacterized protein n=1 Tax=Moorena producens PAL-8-15-08-1 TaxID=1458985 RepID=A0A1D8TZ46_9CYAN|nr:hypothetical protein [Moorena producens]AOX02908.1 hypothetical protein BJP34_28805 [Moorena producens PAL-8-15-08-1]